MDERRIVAPLEEINENMETEYATRYVPAPSEVISGVHLQYPGPPLFFSSQKIGEQRFVKI